MSTFTKPLIVIVLDKYLFQLYEDFEYYWDEKDKENKIVIPALFITDFASVPKLLWSIYPPTGLYTKAALMHDFLYKNGSAIGYERKFCDQALRNAMMVSKVGFGTRWAFYLAVRLFGGKNWQKIT